MDKGIDKQYPDRPSEAIPHALPLSAYTGTYYHPVSCSRSRRTGFESKGRPGSSYHVSDMFQAYYNFTLKTRDDLVEDIILTRNTSSLVALRDDATWPTVNEFEHVSGEYWMLFFHYKDNPEGPFTEYAPVQFRVGSNGQVAGMDITWLTLDTAEDTVEGVVWFDKIE